MTVKETAVFMNELVALYPNLIRKDTDPKLMFKLWEEALKDYEYAAIHRALVTHFKTDKNGYAPSIGQLIKLTEPEDDPFLPKDHVFMGW